MTEISSPPSAGRSIAATLHVEDPTTGRTIGSVPIMTAEDVAAIARGGRAAQPSWAAAGFKARARVFDQARRWLLAHEERVIRTICSETGKTYEDAAVEVSVAVQSFAFWAKHAESYLADERVKGFSPATMGKRVVVRYEPVGVVGVIGPWNYPLVNAFCDAVPALMAGNATILKPSEYTPLTALLVVEMLADSGMPADVFAVATGDGTTGAEVVDVVDYVMFTGSAKTGRLVMERAAKQLTPVSLELGGKDPMIVCADADLERAANAAVFYGLYNAGQVCMSVERVYVAESVHDEFVDRVVSKVRQLRQGPVDKGPGTVEVGAMTFPPQIDLVEAHVQDAVRKGAHVLTGGRRLPGAGRFFQPTVLVDVNHSMLCMREETFGPTLPIMRFHDEEEAVVLANDSEYGLQGSVFSKDVTRGEALARRIEVGGVCVNDAVTNYSAFGAPMGGWKSSGVGSRHGANGIRKFCRTQTVLVAAHPMRKELFMFPYAPWRTKLMSRMTRAIYGR
jgi:acyl-CoA reductase-like NAD-dependent aldehyde dehydrogenase